LEHWHPIASPQKKKKKKCRTTNTKEAIESPRTKLRLPSPAPAEEPQDGRHTLIQASTDAAGAKHSIAMRRASSKKTKQKQTQEIRFRTSASACATAGERRSQPEKRKNLRFGQ